MLLLIIGSSISFTLGCTGGCYVKADAVRTEPNTDCLSLFGGQSADDPTVCATPQLGGVNNCSEVLTLPELSPIERAVTVAPGQKIVWPIPSQAVPPAVVVNHTGAGSTEYVISATLGDQGISIIVPVHDE